jgi:nicotinate phosphoribosyltransferase
MKGLFKPNCVIQSFLDTDLYKLLMQQAVFDLYHGTEVKLAFHCFDKHGLEDYTHIIKEEIEKLEDLRFEESDIWFLSHLGKEDYNKHVLFKNNFLKFLKHYRMSSRQCTIRVDNQNQLIIEAEGSWIDILHFQIFVLTIIQETYNRVYYSNLKASNAIESLDKKIKSFIQLADKKKICLDQLKVCDLGTRNRFNYETQWSCIDFFKKSLPLNTFNGTSNMHIAKEMHIPCIGSQGHEWFMAHQQLSVLHKFQQTALSQWIKVYRGHPGLALLGTLPINSFLKDFDIYYAKLYDGIRVNCPSQLKIIPIIIDHYQSLGIDPKTKYIMLSESLDFDTSLLQTYEKYSPYTNLIFGLRDTITCDLPNYRKLNMIMDLVTCDGQPVMRFNEAIPTTSKAQKDFISYLKSLYLP